MDTPDYAERPQFPRRILQIAAAAALVWMGLAAFLAFAQRSMIFFPAHADEASLLREAAAQNLEPWRDKNGALIGFRAAAPSDDPRPRASILILHGNAGFALDRAAYVPLLRAAAPDRALSLHILEYPGYGARPGTPSQETLLAAASEALALMPQGEPLLVLGESLGTGVAAGLAGRHSDRVAGLVMVTPFDSLASVAQHHYPLLPVRWIMRDKFPTAEWLRNYRGPAVFLIAGRDDIVPPKFGKKLHDAFPGPKLLIVAPDAGHNDIVHVLSDADWQRALGFLF